ncbi:MAG: hypothetical protein U5O39_06005 [Gammaproteobacteria bacterium]|nr:hypothetical protein [Gammaproteobacteria bacterium]
MLVTGQVAEINIGRIELGDRVDIELITGETMQGNGSLSSAARRNRRHGPIRSR